MIVHYTDDPVRDAEATAEDFQRWLDSRPICDQCGEPIQEDTYFLIEGDKLCANCWDQYVQDNIIRIIWED